MCLQTCEAADTAVSGDTATGPAKVVAVVAAVSPEDVEPPTMSNPGAIAEISSSQNISVVAPCDQLGIHGN